MEGNFVEKILGRHLAPPLDMDFLKEELDSSFNEKGQNKKWLEKTLTILKPDFTEKETFKVLSGSFFTLSQ